MVGRGGVSGVAGNANSAFAVSWDWVSEVEDGPLPPTSVVAYWAGQWVIYTVKVRLYHFQKFDCLRIEVLKVPENIFSSCRSDEFVVIWPVIVVGMVSDKIDSVAVIDRIGQYIAV